MTAFTLRGAINYLRCGRSGPIQHLVIWSGTGKWRKLQGVILILFTICYDFSVHKQLNWLIADRNYLTSNFIF